nr:hypothetical protein [Tanacetum cinerariifolium]
SDLDTMSLDDLYNDLKVYKSEVQKKSESNSQNMAFISSAKHSSGNEEVNTASVSTASTNVSTASANIGAAKNHALVADEEALTEFALMAKTSTESKPLPTVESTTDDLQNRDPSVTETRASPSTIISKPFIKFVKAADRPTENKADKGETIKKPAVKYAKLYKKSSKSSSIRGNQRNWNNLKSQQL